MGHWTGSMNSMQEKSLIPQTIAGAIDVIDFFPRMGDNGRWLRFMAAPIRNESR